MLIKTDSSDNKWINIYNFGLNAIFKLLIVLKLPCVLDDGHHIDTAGQVV